MVIILNYQQNNSTLINLLKEKGENFKFSLKEDEILNASKIILPDTENIQKAIRSLQISNLFNLLRIVNKPMLGINNGFFLMCNQILNFNKCGLGLFDFASLNSKNLVEDKLVEGLIQISENSKLLHSNFANRTVLFEVANQLSVNEYTKSFLNYSNQKFTLICENQDHYGIQIFYEQPKNFEIFEEVLTNFLKL